MSKKDNDVVDTNTTAETEGSADKKPAADIIRGRMPLAMVYAIRFKEDGTDSELAAKYRTTPGKVNDIKKNRNFGYITEDAKFSADDITAAKERAEQLGESADLVIAILDAMEPGTEAEIAAFAEKRKSERKPRGKTAEAGDAGDAPAADAPAADVADEPEADLGDLLD